MPSKDDTPLGPAPTTSELAMLAATLAKSTGETEGAGAKNLVDEAARLWHQAKCLLWKWDKTNLNTPAGEGAFEEAYRKMGWGHELDALRKEEGEMYEEMDKWTAEHYLRIDEFHEKKSELLAFFRDGEDVPKEDRFKTLEGMFDALALYPPTRHKVNSEAPIDKDLLNDFLAWRKAQRAKSKREKRAKNSSRTNALDAPSAPRDKPALDGLAKRTKHSKRGAKTDATTKKKMGKRT